MDSSSSWIEVPTLSDICPLPPMFPNVRNAQDSNQSGAGDASIPNVPAMKLALQNAEVKIELHRVLNAIQPSREHGIYVCESFKDPRFEGIDDYWDEISGEAVGLQYLHRLVGSGHTPLTDDASRRLHQFSRLLSRLSQRIDRVILHQH